MRFDFTCEFCGESATKTRAHHQPAPQWCSNACAVARRRVDAEQNLERRFWGKVTFGNDCWEWQAARNNKGYGQFGRGRRLFLAHRVAWEIWYGSAPSQCLLHRCDNPACVRPDHLFEGSIADNNRDMATKGRHVGTTGKHYRWKRNRAA